MSEKRKPKSTNKTNTLNSILCVGTSMCATIAIAICISAWFVRQNDLSFQTAGIFSLLSVCLGAFVSSYVAGKFFEKQGFLSGCIIGILLFLTIIVLGLLSGQTTFSFHSIILLVSLLSSGMIGSNLSIGSLERKRKHIH